MAEPTYAFVIWVRSQQKSVNKYATITNGIAAAIEVTASWKSKSYAATVILTGNYVTFVCCTTKQPSALVMWFLNMM